VAERDDVLALAKAIRSDGHGGVYINAFISRLESQGEAKAVGCRIAEACGLHDGHDGECVAYWAVGAPPPPADEVSEETLRMFAATIARDNESLRVTARAALAARADLATARRERDEAKAEAGRLRRVMEDVQHGASAALATTTEEPKP